MNEILLDKNKGRDILGGGHSMRRGLALRQKEHRWVCPGSEGRPEASATGESCAIMAVAGAQAAGRGRRQGSCTPVQATSRPSVFTLSDGEPAKGPDALRLHL